MCQPLLILVGHGTANACTPETNSSRDRLSPWITCINYQRLAVEQGVQVLGKDGAGTGHADWSQRFVIAVESVIGGNTVIGVLVSMITNASQSQPIAHACDLGNSRPLNSRLPVRLRRH